MPVQKNDILDIDKFNALPHPVTAILYGDTSGYWIETLCVQTGCMRLDVMGQIDLCHFDSVKQLVDIDGGKHDPDEFWIN